MRRSTALRRWGDPTFCNWDAGSALPAADPAGSVFLPGGRSPSGGGGRRRENHGMDKWAEYGIIYGDFLPEGWQALFENVSRPRRRARFRYAALIFPAMDRESLRPIAWPGAPFIVERGSKLQTRTDSAGREPLDERVCHNPGSAWFPALRMFGGISCV